MVGVPDQQAFPRDEALLEQLILTFSKDATRAAGIELGAQGEGGAETSTVAVIGVPLAIKNGLAELETISLARDKVDADDVAVAEAGHVTYALK